MAPRRPRRPARRARRAAARRPRRNPLISNGLGGFMITRRYDPVYVVNGVIGGVPTNTNTTVLTLGTPELQSSIGVDIYNIPFAWSFDLKNLAQYTDITSICDRYKITGATVKVSYNANTATGTQDGATGSGTSQASFMPLINWIQDYDDDGVQPSQALRAKTGLKQRVFKNGNSQVTMKVAPRPAQSVYDTAFAVPNRSMWINSGYSGVSHYGLKGYLQNVSFGPNSKYISCFTFDVTLRVACKDLQ